MVYPKRVGGVHFIEVSGRPEPVLPESHRALIGCIQWRAASGLGNLGGRGGGGSTDPGA
jgi:hypothetical protein